MYEIPGILSNRTVRIGLLRANDIDAFQRI